MSYNQSRGEKIEGQFRKSGRSASSGQHRGFSGGGGGGKGGGVASGAPPPPVSSTSSASPAPLPSLSSNRSFKRSGNGQGSHPRVSAPNASSVASVAAAANTNNRALQNGAHAPSAPHDVPAPSGSKLFDAPRNARALPKAPHSQPTSGASDPTAPTTPAKGDASRAFTLQFGTLSPGVVNGMQIPARTSSAPPNLDEQKRDQARHDSFKTVPVVPIPSASEQQQKHFKKDVVSVNQSNIVESHPQIQTKRDMHVQTPTAPPARPKPSVPPVAGMTVQMPFQQPQIPLQFGGPSAQMQSQGIAASSLQMAMSLPVGNLPQVGQQIFVPGLQSHPLQQQAIMHQGQGLGFGPQMGHQLAPQLANIGIPVGQVGQQFQQQPGKIGPPRVRITHPDTHEELRLDKMTNSHIDSGATGQRQHPSLNPQSQPIPALQTNSYNPSNPISYYPPLQHNSYNPSSMYYPPTTSVPMTSSQITASSQVPRYNYPVGQNGQPISFINTPVINPKPSIKSGPSPNMRGVPEAVKLEAMPASSPSAPVLISVKPPLGSVVDEARMPSVTIITPISKAEGTEMMKPPLEVSTSNQQQETEIRPKGSVEQPKTVCDFSGLISSPVPDLDLSAVSSVLLEQQKQPVTSSPTSVTLVGDSDTLADETEAKKRESLRRSDSVKEHPKRRKDHRQSQQQHQEDPSDSAGGTKLRSSITIGDSDAVKEITQQESNSALIVQVGPGTDTSTLTASSLPSTNVECSMSSEAKSSEGVGSQQTRIVPCSTGSLLEKEELRSASLGGTDALELVSDLVPIKQIGSSVKSDSIVPEVDKNLPGSLDKAEPFRLEGDRAAVTGNGKTEVPDAPSDGSINPKVYPISPEGENLVGIKKLEGAAETCGEVASFTSDLQEGICKEEASCTVEIECTTEELDKSAATSSDSIDAAQDPGGHLPSADFHQDNRPLEFDGIGSGSKRIFSQDVGMTDPSAKALETDSSTRHISSEMEQQLDGRLTELSSGSSALPKDKPSLEPSRGKPAAGKKKKRKEIFSRADAAGASDLYNAYKGPEEKHQAADESQSVDRCSTVVSVDNFQKNSVASEEDMQSKSDVDDWEDVADISTPKLVAADNGQPVHEATGKKKYSRDFLLTFAGQCTDIPEGFKPDIADALMSFPAGKSHLVDREPLPSPGRITDRSPGSSRADHRMVGIVDDDKWAKVPNNVGPGRDSRVDVGHNAPVVGFRPGQGVSHGVLRNPRGQASGQYGGGILSGPMQSYPSQGAVSRNGIDADRWQRGTGIQRGLMPSPQAALQAMHKAEKKYEVGKVSDVEEAKQRQLKAILNKLTPQNFEKLFAQVKEVNIDTAVTLTGVISQIFDKALTEPTFCEMYANFCFHLARELPDFSEDNEKITFKRLLLNKCQEEFGRGEREQAEANKDEEDGEVKQSAEEREAKRTKARRRMLGNIRLIGELYKKRMLTERIMHECIKKLLGQYQNPDEEDIEALCKLMSTIGEMIDHPKAKEHMDAYFDLMHKLSTNQKLSSRVRFLLRDAIDLRKNKWQQRRKVEGPKKIEEVHRDAAHERQAQSSRLARGPVISSPGRRGAPADYGPRGSSVLPSPSSQQSSASRSFQPQVRGFGTQDVRMDDRHLFDSRTLSVPLPQRPVDDDSITLGPQGGLGRGMSIKGQPLISNTHLAETPTSTGDPRRMPSGPSSYSSRPFNSREDTTSRYISDRRVPYDQPSTLDRNSYSGNKDSRVADRGGDRSISAATFAGQTQGSLGGRTFEGKPVSEEFLHDKSLSAIREFYSAKDEEEVAMCIKDLNSPSFYPAMISLWVTDSFERKDMERDVLSNLLVNLYKSQDGLLNQGQLIQGFESVLSSLEDTVNDAPRAPEFLGRLLAKVISENVVQLLDIGRLLQEGGEEPGRLLEIGLASDVLASILQSIKADKGESVFREILKSSNLRLEDFRPPQPTKSKLDSFL